MSNVALLQIMESRSCVVATEAFLRQRPSVFNAIEVQREKRRHKKLLLDHIKAVPDDRT